MTLNNPTEVESEPVRRTTHQWFTEVVPDRLNDMQKSAIVVIMQRVHENDVSGIILEDQLDYTHLMIPMEYESSRYPVGYTGTSIGWMDPRTVDGELAWVERFPPHVIERLKKKGAYAWAGQYQQSPEVRGGSIIKRDWWQPWDDEEAKTQGVEPGKYPPFNYILASLDTAYTEKEENDYSALTIWGVWSDRNGNSKIMLIYSWHDRLMIHDLVEKTAASCKRFKVDKILVEGKASGKSVIQELYRLYGSASSAASTEKYQGWGIEEVNPSKFGDKVARVHAISHLFSEGLIYAPDREWAQVVVDNMAVFPRGSFDDLTDSASQALRYLRQIGLAVRREEYMIDEREDLRYKRPKQPLYGM